MLSLLPSQPASAVDIPVWEWNIFGTCATVSGRPGNCGSTRLPSGTKPEEMVHYFVATRPDPWTIGLNEVCGRQRDALNSRLAPYGYTLRFAKSDGLTGSSTTPGGVPFSSVNCGGRTAAEQVFGNAVLVLGGVNAWSFPSDLYYTGSKRNYSCVVATTYIGNRMSCVTHLENNASASESQGNQAFLQSVNYMNNMGHKIILTGDRNRGDYRSWPAYFDEFDTRPSGSRMDTFPTSALDKKYDWIFAGPKSLHTPLGSSSRHCVGGIPTGGTGWTSDHCLVFGVYRV